MHSVTGNVLLQMKSLKTLIIIIFCNGFFVTGTHKTTADSFLYFASDDRSNEIIGFNSCCALCEHLLMLPTQQQNQLN